MKNDRLFQIVYLLLEKGSVTAPELAGKFGVSVRTVYRDVDALSVAGVPIYTTVGKGGGISLIPGYSFDKALLSDSEQNQILFAIQSLRATDQPVGTLLAKLGGMFQKQTVNWIEVDFSRWGMGRVDTKRFELIRNAILEKRMLHIQYCGASGDTSSRTIKPFKLIFKDKNWYLQAYCLKADDYRLFKVGRIVELMPTGETFSDTYLDAPSLEEAITSPAYASFRLKLRFSPTVAFRVYDEFDRYCIEKQPDGSLLVSTAFPLDGWGAGYLLTFGTDVRIIEPPEARTMFANHVKNVYEHHKT